MLEQPRWRGAGTVVNCGVCGSGDLAMILDMGIQPLAERMGDGTAYPLELLQCRNCSLVQLGYIVPQRELFPPGHPYATGNTAALRRHFTWLAADIDDRVSDGDLVVDIGASDGTLLAAVRPGVVRMAVEPTDRAWACTERGLLTAQAFWTAELAATIRKDHGPAKVVTACNVMAHVPDPHDFMDGVDALLDDDGVLIAENHDVASVIDGMQIDTVYHEHLRYYSPASFAHLLAMHGFEVIATGRVNTHGGSFRATARRQRSGELAGRALVLRDKLHDLVAGLHAAGNDIYGIGAATRAVPLICYAQIAGYITCVCEVPGSAKIGQLMPGTSIPVVDEDRLLLDQPPYALLLSWHLADRIIPALRLAGYRGRFIIPLPEPRVTGG
jgi:C-methyltransferase C-terminal domain/Putative zinc binding domain/Methyltransferase domain